MPRSAAIEPLVLSMELVRVQRLGEMESKFGEFAADLGRRRFEGFVSVHTVY